MSQLTKAEVAVLHEALDDEYRAWAIYDQVIADFGEVRPFTNIREAEGRHIEALYTLFDNYGIPIPENPWPGKVEHYPSLQAACEAGVSAEIANGEMYDRLLAATQQPDIKIVLRNLQEASQKRHLAAFERGANREASECGRGNGHRHRGGRN